MSHMLKRLLGFVLIGTFSSTTLAAQQPTAEDIAVLRAVLAPQCDRSGPGYVLLSTKAAGTDSSDHVPADWAEAAELTAQLRARGESPGSWSGVRVCKKVLVRREGDIQRLIEDAPNLDVGWKNFHSAYPGALAVMYVSLPAYSSDGNRAVVVTGSGCGSLCGSGEIVELEKKDGVWRRVRDQGTWIS